MQPFKSLVHDTFLLFLAGNEQDDTVCCVQILKLFTLLILFKKIVGTDHLANLEFLINLFGILNEAHITCLLKYITSHIAP